MRFKRYAKIQCGFDQITIAPLIDLILLVLIFFMLSSSFTFPSIVNVKLPKVITSDTVQEENVNILITSENVLYLNNKIVTIKELQQELGKESRVKQPVLIKADRRSSVGRVVDVWDICRDLGIEKINIATTKQNNE